MKIKRKQEEQKVNFPNLKSGDCFKYEECIYIKSGSEAAINVADGELEYHYGGYMVTPLPNAVLHTNEDGVEDE